MVNIAACKIDERGRITLPDSFLRANGIHPNKSYVAVMKPKQSSLEITVAFVHKDDLGEVQTKTNGGTKMDGVLLK